jgi:hypothetical protein
MVYGPICFELLGDARGAQGEGKTFCKTHHVGRKHLPNQTPCQNKLLFAYGTQDMQDSNRQMLSVLLPGAYERKLQRYLGTTSRINSSDIRLEPTRVCSEIPVVFARMRQEAVGMFRSPSTRSNLSTLALCVVQPHASSFQPRSLHPPRNGPLTILDESRCARRYLSKRHLAMRPQLCLAVRTAAQTAHISRARRSQCYCTTT